MKDNLKTGALIAHARKEKQITQKELAAALHVSDTTISKWERGAGFPDVSLIEPLTAALGLSIAELFAGERAEEPLPETCEALLSDVIVESGAQGRARRKFDYTVFALITALILLIAVPLLFFRTTPPAVMRGTYASLPADREIIIEKEGEFTTIFLKGPAEIVQLSAGWADENGKGDYVLSIDSRVVEEGTYATNGDGTFTLTGMWADGTPRVFFVEPQADGGFRMLLPAIYGDKPLLFEKIGKVPAYFSTTYGDEAQYRENYLWPPV